MAAADPPRPVNLTTLGLGAGGVTVWRMNGRLHVTVFVKATFELSPDAAMRVIPAEEIITAEVHHAKNPMRSVRFTPDVAPYLPRADVILTGHACAPEGSKVTDLAVRLAIFRGELVLDKTIQVTGDKKGDEIVPFERIPLMYERAYGGIGWEDNPLGAGFGAASSGTKPNLLDPNDPAKPACFAPISRGWPLRKRLVGAAERRALDRPIVEIPDGFGWAYYQAAPEDQRIGYLHGDEWVILDGFHPVHTYLQSYLPGARGLARVYGMADGGAGHPLAMVGDTLRIDADHLRCSVVWRGSFPIPHEDALAAIKIVTGVETGFDPIEWPTAVRASPASPSPSPSAPAARPPVPADHAATMVLVQPDTVPDEVEVIEDVTDLAHTLNTEDAPDSSPPPPKWDRTIATSEVEAKPAPGWDRTVTTGDAAPDRPTMPFVRSALLSRIEPPRSQQDSVRSGDTITLQDEDVAVTLTPPPTLPFQRPPAPPPPPASRALHRPIAPRAAPSPAPAPTPAPKRDRVIKLGMEIASDPSLAVDVVAWGLQPSRDCLTVIAKATCDLVAGGPATIRAQAAPLEGERREEGACVYPSDLAPYKVRADVTLAGHATAPGEARTMEVVFRFGGRDGNSFTRRIMAFGARHWEKGPAGMRPSPPEAFHRMPLGPDRAFGGPRYEPNPEGIGHPDPKQRGPIPLPFLEDPERRMRTPNQTPQPVFLSPIPIAWKDRWASLGRSHTPWYRLPEDLDWTHYQAAPVPQQLAFLRGDEPFAILGVHPQHPVLEGSLPGIRARCFVAWGAAAGGAFEELPLHLDTVTFEVDKGTISLVYRGTIGVPDERSPGIEAIMLRAERASEAGMTLADARAELQRRTRS